MEFASLVFFFLIIIPSAIIHEYFHGVVAFALGDPTAKLAGRLTLNPLAHIDPMGTIFLPAMLFLASGGGFVFAYAKPVPINPLFLRHRHGEALVALAGPIANFATAAVLAIVIRLLPMGNFTAILSLIVYANILLAVFNLLPIPPLDGSKILFQFFPTSWLPARIMLEQFGFFILILFLVAGFHWLSPIILGLFRFLVGEGVAGFGI